jgi:replicative DNA helicase
MQNQKAGKTPHAPEAEKGLCAIVLNHPDQASVELTKIGFSVDDIFDPTIKDIVKICLELSSQGTQFDIRVVYEKIKEHHAHLEFYQLSELYTNISSLHVLKNYCKLIQEKAALRALQQLARKTLEQVEIGELDSAGISADAAVQIESISQRMSPPSVVDTRALLLDAARRYEQGEDTSSIVKTGFTKVDNLTPIRYGDFLIIGGETKSGKTTLALNIVANYITNHEI